MSARLDRIRARIRKPPQACYRVDWGTEAPRSCPRDPNVKSSPSMCETCQMASERYFFIVQWTGRRSGDEDGR